MFNVELSGFDELQKNLAEAQRAMESLNGELTTLHIDPDNPQSAIAEMEGAVDAKLAPYQGNSIVEKFAEVTKEHFRKGILERAEEAKRKATEGEAK